MEQHEVDLDAMFKAADWSEFQTPKPRLSKRTKRIVMTALAVQTIAAAAALTIRVKTTESATETETPTE